MNKFNEKIMSRVFLISALMSVISILLICFFLFSNGVPAIFKIGVSKFLLGKEWSPSDIPPTFGIFPMIVGSIYVTIGAVLIGVPIGIMTALFVAKVCPKKFYSILKESINLMAGIPSVVYGFFGIIILVPIMGNSILTASVLLGIMILPTIIGISESAIKSVPTQYYEGALALGSGHYRSLFLVVLPAAKSGIIASIVLAIGRAIGETMAVIMVAGNQAKIPVSIFKGVRTLTANIVLEMGYAAELHRESLIATGVILLLFILLINICFSIFKMRGSK